MADHVAGLVKHYKKKLKIKKGHTHNLLTLWNARVKYVNMVLNVHRHHKVYQGRGKVGEGGMEVGEEGDYIPQYGQTVTIRMTPALRWAATRAILMFH